MPNLLHYEKLARKEGFLRVAGVDEAGRGPLAGPVVACACIIPYGVFFPLVNDSKQLSPKLREELFLELTSHPKVEYGIGIVSHEEIDRINIARATEKAMLEACSKLASSPDLLLVDGVKLPHPTVPHKKIIKGDTLSHSIAAASILAKVTRDRIMVELDTLFPGYGFKSHKGYGTEAHLKALSELGPCAIHRKSFAPVVQACLRSSLSLI